MRHCHFVRNLIGAYLMSCKAKELWKRWLVFYVNGDKKKGLKKHRIPVLCDRPAVGDTSKVIKRIKETDVQMQFLL